MKSDKFIKINNRLMNQGISFSKNTSLADIIQAHSYLTRFILDVIQDKSEVYALEENNDEISKENKKRFAELLAEWITILNDGTNENE